MNDEEFKKELLKKMDALIKLSTISSMKEKSQMEKVSVLNGMGFGPKEIANLINTSSNSVSVALNKLKKKSSKNDKQRNNESLEGPEESVNSESLPADQEEEKRI